MPLIAWICARHPRTESLMPARYPNSLHELEQTIAALASNKKDVLVEVEKLTYKNISGDLPNLEDD